MLINDENYFYSIEVLGTCLWGFLHSECLIFNIYFLNQQKTPEGDPGLMLNLLHLDCSVPKNLPPIKPAVCFSRQNKLLTDWQTTFFCFLLEPKKTLAHRRGLWLTAEQTDRTKRRRFTKTLNCKIAEVPPLVSLTELWMCSLPVAQSLCSCDMSLRSWHMLSILWHSPPPPPLHLPVYSAFSVKLGVLLPSRLHG